MKTIPLTRGKVALVDDDDYPKLYLYKWHVHHTGSTKIYAGRRVVNGHKQDAVLMHRQIMDATKVQHIDHRDGDGLNNQRFNLRFCTRAQNAQNASTYSNNKSGVTGVYWRRDSQKWHAQIQVNGVRKSLGCFKKLRDAELAYKIAARNNFGEFYNLSLATSESKV